MKRRLLPLLLAVILMAGLLAACSGDNAGNQTSQESTMSEPEPPDEGSNEEQELPDQGDPDINIDDVPMPIELIDPTTVPVGSWSLAVEGVEGVQEFTSEDAAELAPVSVAMTITNKNGEAETSVYTGVTLASVLEYLGVDAVSSVVVVAADDFEAEYSADLAMAGDTLLAWASGGEAFKGEPPLRMCPAQGTGNQFVKNTAKIVVGS